MTPIVAAPRKRDYEHVMKLYAALLTRAGFPVSTAKTAVAQAFGVIESKGDNGSSNWTVLAYYSSNEEDDSGVFAGFTRVVFNGDFIVVAPLVIDLEMDKNKQYAVASALMITTDELAHKVHEHEVSRWRDTSKFPFMAYYVVS